MMDVFAGLLAFALLAESVVTNLNWTIETFKKADDQKPGYQWEWQRLTALAVSVGLCVAYNIDAFAVAGYQSVIPYIGAVATGFIVARGANVVNDLVSKLLPK